MVKGPSATEGTTAVGVPSLWRHGGFLKLWAGETVSQFGAQLTHLAIPVLAILLLDASEFEIGLLGAADTAAFLIVGLPAGAWVDRWLKRRVMIAADILRAAALAVIPLLWAFGMLHMWHVFFVAVVIGVGTVFFDVSYQSYVPILVRSGQLGDANGKLEATAQIARIGGPAVGGVLITVLSAPFLILGTAVGYLVSFLFLWRIRDEEKPAIRAERAGLWSEIREGASFVWRHPLIRTITLNTALANFFGSLGLTLTALLVLRELGLDAAVLGLVLSIGSVGGLLGALATPWLMRVIGEGTVIPLASVLGGVAMFLLPLTVIVPGFAIALLIVAEFLFAFGVLVYNIAQVTFRQRVCPPRLLGRMNASIRFVVWGVMPIANLAAGALATWIGVVPTMWISAVGVLVSSAVVVFSPLFGMRTLPTDHLEHTEQLEATGGLES